MKHYKKKKSTKDKYIVVSDCESNTFLRYVYTGKDSILFNNRWTCVNEGYGKVEQARFFDTKADAVLIATMDQEANKADGLSICTWVSTSRKLIKELESK